jgi:hypothetical protein
MKSIGSLLFGWAVGCIAVLVIAPFVIFYLSGKSTTSEVNEFPETKSADPPAIGPHTPIQQPAQAMDEAHHGPETLDISS